MSRTSETEWNRLSVAQRRALSRALRRDGAINSQHRDLARWHAERSIRSGLPQAVMQGGLGVLWLGSSLADTVGDASWWFHVSLATLQVAFALAMRWVLG